MYISPFLAPSLRQMGASNPQLIWDPQRLVESLLRRGADVSARSNDGESALHVVPGGYAELEVDPRLLDSPVEVDFWGFQRSG